MIPVNQALHDAAVGHAVDLTHLSNGVVARLIALLNRVDAELFAALTSALEHMPLESFTVERLDALLLSVRLLNARAYLELGRALSAQLADFVNYEADYQRLALLRALPSTLRLTIGVAEVNVQQVYGAAMARPFQGRLLKEWAASIEANRMARIRDAIRIGYVQGATTAEIVRKVRGTRAKGYADGIVEIDRREAEAVIRTALSHTAGFVRDKFVDDNSSVIKAISWTATLDTRTSETCFLRDGKQYTPEGHQPIGHKLPWLGGPGAAHWNSVVEGTLITTARGSIPIESVVVGDSVLTHNGRYKLVTALFSKKCDSGVVRVAHTESGRILRATDDHPVLTVSGGWKFVGALEIGDQLFCNPENLGKVGGALSFISTESKDSPSGIDNQAIALSRTIELVAANINFKGDFEICASEIEDRAADVMLSDPELVKRDECAKHHFFALSQMLLKSGRHRLSQILSSLHGQWDASRPVATFGVVSSDPVGFSDLCGNTGHLGGVVGQHSCGVARVSGGSLFGFPEGPVIGPFGSGHSAGFKVNQHLLGFVSDGNSMFLGVARQTPVCQAHVPLDLSKGVSSDGVVFGNDGDVVDFRFEHDAIISLELQDYKSFVYDLSVDGDCSYVASGIVVSNCRSVSVPVTVSYKDLGINIDDMTLGERASMDGVLPSETTYAQWIQKQSAARQDQVLGATRGKLMRDGGMTLGKFANDKGRMYTLAQLREQDAEAFRRAGL